MRHGGANVERSGQFGERIDVLAEGFPSPVDSLVQGGARNVLNGLHQLDQKSFPARPDRSETDPAIPHHRRGDAVVDRRPHLGIPRGLTVIVRVDIDPTRRNQRAISVDLLSTRILNGAHGDDLIAVDRHIGRPSCRTGSIDNLATADHEIMHDPQCLKAPAARDNGACS